MPVTYVGTGISLEISPSETIAVLKGEFSSEMPVPIEETGISQEISPYIKKNLQMTETTLV